MSKIVQFPIEKVKKEYSFKVTKLTKEEITLNLEILEKEGIKKEAALKDIDELKAFVEKEEAHV